MNQNMKQNKRKKLKIMTFFSEEKMKAKIVYLG